MATGWMFDNTATARKLMNHMRHPVFPNSHEAHEIANILADDDVFYNAWKAAKRKDRSHDVSSDEPDDYGTEGPRLGKVPTWKRTIHNEIDIRPLIQKSVRFWLEEEPDSWRNGNKSAINILKQLAKLHIRN